MHTCPKCNVEFESGEKFCQNCGCNLETEFVETPTCPKCDKSNSSSQILNGNYPKASLGMRFVASLLDGVITIALAIPAFFVFFIGVGLSVEHHDDRSVYMYILAAFLYCIPLLYSFIKDGFSKGQSPGKKAAGLMVVYLPNNTPCTKGQSAVRGLISVLLELIPYAGWLIEPIIVLATRDGRRLADRAARTQVIDRELYNN